MKGLSWLFQYIVSVLRVFCVLIIALFLPQMFIWHAGIVQQSAQTAESSAKFKLGIENISDSLASNLAIDEGQECRVGLITNHTGTDQEGNRTNDILAQKGFKIKKLFMPAQNAANIKNNATVTNDMLSEAMAVPVVTLQSPQGQSLFPKEALSDIDALMFDMQDSGMRHYGYITTLLHAMQAAASHDKKFVVFDRPNLLGWCMEGTCSAQDQTCEQDTATPIPMRHGMTVGELATYFNKHVLTKSVDLHVVQMRHYDRQTEARKPLLCSLSPNINTIDSCYGYSFLGLLGEVAPFEIGIGTDKAFQCILLPEQYKLSKQKWHELRIMLKDHGIESKLYRSFSPRKNSYCAGLRLYIHDINRFSSFNTLLSVLKFFKDSGVPLTFSEQFDKVLGTHKVRELLEGKIAHTELALEVNEELHSFFKKAANCFLYKPFPKMIQV